MSAASVRTSGRRDNFPVFLQAAGNNGEPGSLSKPLAFFCAMYAAFGNANELSKLYECATHVSPGLLANVCYYGARAGGISSSHRHILKQKHNFQSAKNRRRIVQSLGTWERLHDRLRGDVREAYGRDREPSAGIIDSQAVKTTEKGGSAVMTEASAPWVANATSSSTFWACFSL
jgi:transposase